MQVLDTYRAGGGNYILDTQGVSGGGGSTVTGVTVTPGTATASQTLAATVNGTGGPSQAVGWSATLGSINSGGDWTAPAATGVIQTGTIRATSTQDGSYWGEATVTIAAAVVGGYTITAARANLLYQIALLHGLDIAHPLTVSPSARTAGTLSQIISGSDAVTITTSAAPALAGSLDDWIDALAAIHGLTATLIVSTVTRSAGAVSQILATVGDTTTVTRQ